MKLEANLQACEKTHAIIVGTGTFVYDISDLPILPAPIAYAFEPSELH